MRKYPEMKHGELYGRLSFEKDVGLKNISSKSKGRFGLFKCSCGKQKEIRITLVHRGDIKSCGCLLSDTARAKVEKIIIRHEHQEPGDEKLYTLWHRIKNRCYNQNNTKDYPLYGGRGIKMADEWISDSNAFVGYIKKHLGNPPTKNHTLDRIDSTKDYEPNNLRWSSKYIQSRNRGMLKNNTTGHKGVYLRKNGKYRAVIHIDGKNKSLGDFSNIKDAIMARRRGENELWNH